MWPRAKKWLVVADWTLWELVGGSVSCSPRHQQPRYNRRIAAKRLNQPIEPMTLGNMRASCMRSLDVSRRLDPSTALSASLFLFLIREIFKFKGEH
jgi:hypothetical protein